MKPWLTVMNRAGTQEEPDEIIISGNIGASWWDETSVSSNQFIASLNAIPKGRHVTVGINSNGGSVADGLEIYNAIKRRGNVTTRVDGYAASIASVIALAGDTVISPISSIWMIHEPWSMEIGDAEKMRKAADMLEKHGETLAGIYANETGKSLDEVRAAMKSETWFTGEEAVDWGLADKANEDEVDLTQDIPKAYKRVPAELMDKRGVFAGRIFSRFNLVAGTEGGLKPPPTEQNQQQEATDMSANANTATSAEASTSTVTPAQAAPAEITRDHIANLTQAITTLSDRLNQPAPAPAPSAGVEPLRISPVGADPVAELKGLGSVKAQAKAYFSQRDHFRKVLNANSFTTLTNTIIASLALEAFTKRLTPLMAFATNFSNEAVQRGDKVKVCFVSAASAATDFSGSYAVQGSTAEGKDITIDKRKYVSWGLTTEELATQPQLNLERFAKQKGNALAKAVLVDIWSLITAANFGSSAYSQGSGGDVVTVTAANFDSTEVSQLLECCDVDDWPEEDRALVLSPAYYAALFNDADVIGTLGLNGGSALGDGVIRGMLGFDIYKSNVIPANAENLTGFAANPNGILIAMRSLIPEANVANRPMVQPLTDPESGITIVMREWFSPEDDTTKRVLECNYGYLKGNADAVKRIKSS